MYTLESALHLSSRNVHYMFHILYLGMSIALDADLLVVYVIINDKHIDLDTKLSRCLL